MSSVQQRLSDARRLILYGAGEDFPAHPYLVTALSNVRFVELPPHSVRVALVLDRKLPPHFLEKDIICIDPDYRIYYDPDFIQRLNLRDLAELLIHEVWHPLRRHTEREKDLLGIDPADFPPAMREVLLRALNVCEDAEINQHFNYIPNSYVQRNGILPEHLEADFGESFEQMFRRLWPQIKKSLEELLRRQKQQSKSENTQQQSSQQQQQAAGQQQLSPQQHARQQHTQQQQQQQGRQLQLGLQQPAQQQQQGSQQQGAQQQGAQQQGPQQQGPQQQGSQQQGAQQQGPQQQGPQQQGAQQQGPQQQQGYDGQQQAGQAQPSLADGSPQQQTTGVSGRGSQQPAQGDAPTPANEASLSDLLNQLDPQALNELINALQQKLGLPQQKEQLRGDLDRWPGIEHLQKEQQVEDPLPDLLKRAIERKTAEDLITHFRRTEKSRGSGFSPGLLRWAEETLAPERIPYQRIFASVVSRYLSLAQTANRRLSFARPSRRQVPGLLLPGTQGMRYRVGFVFDTSGSVSDKELGLYLKELRACLRTYSHMCEVMYFSADTRVHTQMQVHLGDLKPERLQIRGGGGTDLDKVIEEIAAMRRPPQVLFVLTDGETPWPAEKPRTIERVVIGLSAPPSPTFPPPRWADHIVALYEREAERSLG